MTRSLVPPKNVQLLAIRKPLHQTKAVSQQFQCLYKTRHIDISQSAMMDSNAFHENMAEMRSLAIVTATVGFMLLIFLALRLVLADNVAPGIPELKGMPILGVIPVYLRHGMPQLLNELIAIGEDGISYAHVVTDILVSVHDPAMVREVLAYPEEIASR